MSYLRGLYCFVFGAAVVMLVAADVEPDLKVGRSEVRVAARSGMMEFRRERRNKANETVQTRPIQIRMAQMVQLDKDGNEVTNCTAPEKLVTRRRRSSGQGAGKGGMREHEGPDNGRRVGFTRPHRPWVGRNGTGPGKRFSDFNNTEFTIGQKKQNVKLSHSRSLKALVRRFHANLGAEVGNLAIDMALPENDGEIDIDGEKQKLKKGDLKFNIELTEWIWCGDEGEDGAAAFLDVYIEVNSTQRPKVKRGRSASAPASFDLGDSTTMSFSGKYEADNGNWTDVVEGYPKLDEQDSSLVIVRFARFNSSLLYDPTVSVEDDVEDDVDDNNDKGGSGSGFLSVSAMFVTMTTALTYILLK